MCVCVCVCVCVLCVCVCVTCSNEMSHVSANLISRIHRVNIARRYLTMFDFSSPKHTLMFCLSTVNAYFPFILLFSTFYYLFLERLRNISRMNFVKQNR